MNTDVPKMKAKLTAFFDAATAEDISALLKRTNYDFYKNVTGPDNEDWFERAFASTEEEQVWTVQVPVIAVSHRRVPNPIIYIGRSSPGYRECSTPVADHKGMALAA